MKCKDELSEEKKTFINVENSFQDLMNKVQKNSIYLNV